MGGAAPPPQPRTAAGHSGKGSGGSGYPRNAGGTHQAGYPRHSAKVFRLPVPFLSPRATGAGRRDLGVRPGKKHPSPAGKQPAAEQRPSVSGPLIRPSQKAQRQVTMHGTCPSLMYLSLFCLFIYHLHCACLAGSPPCARPTPPGALSQCPQPGVPTQRPPGHPPTADPAPEPAPQSREAWGSTGTMGARPPPQQLGCTGACKENMAFPGNVGKQTRLPPGLRLPSAIGDPTSHGNDSLATFGSGDGGEGSRRLGAPGMVREPGGDTRDSARQERQEFVPAQGNHTQV